MQAPPSILPWDDDFIVIVRLAPFLNMLAHHKARAATNHKIKTLPKTVLKKF